MFCNAAKRSIDLALILEASVEHDDLVHFASILALQDRSGQQPRAGGANLRRHGHCGPSIPGFLWRKETSIKVAGDLLSPAFGAIREPAVLELLDSPSQAFEELVLMSAARFGSKKLQVPFTEFRDGHASQRAIGGWVSSAWSLIGVTLIEQAHLLRVTPAMPAPPA